MKTLLRSSIAAAAMALSAQAIAATVSEESDRGANETTHQANVSSEHAIVGPPEQHCWIEKETIGGNVNVTGAVAGAVVGSIIGHQVGRERGNTAATIGGAAIGGAVGSQIGRKPAQTQDVERCETAPNQSSDSGM